MILGRWAHTSRKGTKSFCSSETLVYIYPATLRHNNNTNLPCHENFRSHSLASGFLLLLNLGDHRRHHHHHHHYYNFYKCSLFLDTLSQPHPVHTVTTYLFSTDYDYISCPGCLSPPGILYSPCIIITNSVALVRERTIPTERPPLVGEVSANFCW
jgi:hypothetical protein